MILAVDVSYSEPHALVAGVLFKQWESAVYERLVTVPVQNVAAYESGCFYKRELPCILQLIEILEESLCCIVVDGYVSLEQNRAGLGMHLWHSLAATIPVIGVAKTCFKDTPQHAALYRGSSTKPLYISSVGMELATAKHNIAQMHGHFRMPTLLKCADQLSRGTLACSGG